MNKFFKVSYSSNIGVRDYSMNNEQISTKDLYIENPLTLARMALPYDTPYYYSFDENGNMIKGDRAAKLHYSGVTMPWFINSQRDVKRKQITLNMSLNEQLTPIEGLTFTAVQSLFGYDTTLDGRTNPRDKMTTPMGDVISASTGTVQEDFDRYYSYTFTHTGEYRKNFGDHYLNVLVGEESRIEKANGFGAFSTGQNDARRLLLTAGTTMNPAAQSDSRYTIIANSVFGNVEYNYKEKYYVYGSLRTDGSSKFAPDHRWGTFWSLGAKWDAKKENFLKDVSWLDDLSLSINYGTTGNDSGADAYDYFGLFGSGSNYNGQGSITISQPSNYELTWERVGKLNIGLNIGVFDRLNLDANFYRNKTTDMLMSIPYSMTTGFGSGVGNIGAMTNTGFELTANVDIIKNKDMRWTFTANVGYNKNEITELFNGRDEYALSNYGMKLKVGRPYGELYYVRYAGVDTRTGEPMWYDKDGNITKVYNEERDAVLLGKNRYAPWIGGFGTNFTWKGFSVIADFTWQSGKYMMVNDDMFIKNYKFATSFNQSVDMLNTWTHPGQVTDIPAAGYEAQFDDHMVSNASFLRMKTLTLQYELPQKWMQATRYIKGVKVFGIARNLFTITNFKGYDPEPDSNAVVFNYPNTRQFVIGAELTF